MSTVTSYKSVMRLTITEIQEQDYGEYKCVAKNPRGETDGNIKIYGEWMWQKEWNRIMLRVCE